ncbi:hypothetical protein WI23_16755 [Burkholderia oklahomensis C6786]|nr:hypothetical protein WI23_16755 [Burkholderia oklahomensis C6786]KUY63488.1 hypothetical protein WI23_00270 [Burkholderia oklahomensis C6786]
MLDPRSRARRRINGHFEAIERGGHYNLSFSRSAATARPRDEHNLLPVSRQSSAVDRRSRGPANCRPGAIRQSAARVEHSRKTRRRPGDRTSPDDAAMMGESPTNA